MKLSLDFGELEIMTKKQYHKECNMSYFSQFEKGFMI